MLCVSVRVGGIGCANAPTSMFSCAGFTYCYFLPWHTSESEFVCVTAAQQPAGQSPTSLCVLWLLCRFPCGGVSESKRLNEPLIERMTPLNNLLLFCLDYSLSAAYFHIFGIEFVWFSVYINHIYSVIHFELLLELLLSFSNKYNVCRTL